jgi:REP element-mobilizing transposase RayT
MSDKFRNKYRVSSARAQWWNYSNTGIYFITVCAYRHECLFGDIPGPGVETHGPVEPHGRAALPPGAEKPKLAESPIGAIVLQEWYKSFEIRTELFCDAFVLMPNHLHAILRIENTVVEPHGPVEPHGRAALRGAKPITPIITATGVAYRPPKSISSFVAGFKSSATQKINILRNTPGAPVWQPRFHDHIIRNMTEYRNIANYIENNPAKWANDRFNTQ